MPTRQHEAVAPVPVGPGGVVPQVPLEQQVGHGREGRGGAGVARTGLLDGVEGQ